MSDPPRRSWWSRNWRWFVPTGCLAAIVLLAGFVAFVLWVVGGAMKSSDAYRHALAEARKSPAVAAALGEPLRDGWFASGSINVNGPSGTADLAIPIAGPKGKGTVFVEAAKSAGRWTYSTLAVEITRTNERIDLLAAGRAARPPGEEAPGP